MSLRARLTASFAVVLAVPLIVAAFVVHASVVRQTDNTERADLRAGFTASVALFQATQQQDTSTTEGGARSLASRRDVAQAFTSADLASVLAARLRSTLDILALVRPDGSVIGLSASEPSFLPGVEPPPFGRIVSTRPNGWANLSEVRVSRADVDARGTSARWSVARGSTGPSSAASRRVRPAPRWWSTAYPRQAPCLRVVTTRCRCIARAPCSADAWELARSSQRGQPWPRAYRRCRFWSPRHRSNRAWRSRWRWPA